MARVLKLIGRDRCSSFSPSAPGGHVSIYDSEYLDAEDEDKAVEIRLEDITFRTDDSPAVVLAIKRTCSLSGETKVGHVTLGHENTLRLYLES